MRCFIDHIFQPFWNAGELQIDWKPEDQCEWMVLSHIMKYQDKLELTTTKCLIFYFWTTAFGYYYSNTNVMH